MVSKLKQPTPDLERSERYLSLKRWLEKHQARNMWQVERPNSYIECWMFPSGREAIIQLYVGQDENGSYFNGWTIYTTDDSLAIVDSLTDAEARLGLKE